MKPREKKEVGQGHIARSQLRGRPRTMALTPYTGFDWPEPVTLHSHSPPQSVCSNMNTEELTGFLCMAYGFSDTLYMVTPCSLTHSFS